VELHEVIEQHELDSLAQTLRQATPAASPVNNVTLTRRDGTTLRCELHTVAMVGPGGEIVGYRGVARDVAERLLAEHTRRLAAVGQLSAGVAHEFNNIMASMSGRAEHAAMKQTPEACARLVDTVLSGVARGAEICRDLVRFATPPAPAQQPADVCDFMEGALSDCAPALDQCGVTVVRRYEAPGAVVQGDADQLRQVIAELVDNGCHAMPSGGTLTVHVRRQSVGAAMGDDRSENADGRIVIAVTDTGTGIAASAVPRIFDPFYTTKGALGGGVVPGTGLGLSVAHGVVQAHYGTIAVRSEIGAGTTFELQFPEYVPDVLELPSALGVRVGLPRPLGRQVLLAEDEVDLRDAIAELLTERGFEVTTAADTQEALAALKTSSFDVLVSDLMMPGGGGQEVIAEARGQGRAPLIIVITGRTDPAVAQDVAAMGATACLQKPFGLADILGAIEAQAM